MALIRCEKHNIPYNEANPRGCPACWQEKAGEGEAQLMRELARASRGVPHVEVLPPPETTDDLPGGITADDWPPPVTTPPRLPTRPLSVAQRLGRFLQTNWTAVGGVGGLVVILVLVWLITRPTFVEALDPPPLRDEALPFPVQPNTVIEGAFALFGPVAPAVNPDSPTLARYEFEDGVLVDALNSAVYAVTLTSTRRSWTGNRVGLGERLARGRLALLGEVRELPAPSPAPFPVAGHMVFSSASARPRRTLVAEVRPPNGCLDVRVDLAPRILGRVARGDETFVSVARRGGTVEWVAVRVRAVSRSMDGPYAGAAACDAP